MPVINLHSLFKEWLMNRKDLFRGQHVSDNYDRFPNIKLKLVEDVEWTPAGNIDTVKGPTRKINIAKGQGASWNSKFTTQIQASVSNDSLSRIILTEPLIKGLTTSIDIPLDDLPVPEELGPSVKVNLKEVVTEHRVTEKTNLLSPERHITSGCATAHVRCYENQYEGRFECKVAMSGKVMMDDVRLDPHKIAEIIKDLKEWNDEDREDLDAFSYDRHHVYFTLTGEGEFRWPNEDRMEVEWTT